MFMKKIKKFKMRVAKLISSLEDLTYVRRLKHPDQPTIHYRRVCGDIIMVCKILNEKNRQLSFK